MNSTVIGPDGQPRCGWCASAPEFFEYHDNEWGYPVGDDIRLFEKICLEGFQSGLSWRTILAKRENFRAVFCGFDFEKVATFNKEDVERLLQNKGIIRHRGKIEAVINNAQRAIEMVEEEGSLAAYFWSFEPSKLKRIKAQTLTTSPESIALAKGLKKKGWKFIGPTTVYAFLQSMGFINDHLEDCVMHEKAERARQCFDRPVSVSGR